jgi:membrane protease subunit (stomatin/prohibitin family)
MGLGAGVALGQVLVQNLAADLQGGVAGAAAAQAVGVKAKDVMVTLKNLGDLKTKGILTAEEFDTKRVALLKKLV